MKKVRCFGKKKVTRIDSSATEAFFKDAKSSYNFGDKKAPTFESPQKEDKRKSLFSSPIKLLNSSMKAKRYKPKRKWKKTVKKLLDQSSGLSTTVADVSSYEANETIPSISEELKIPSKFADPVVVLERMKIYPDDEKADALIPNANKIVPSSEQSSPVVYHGLPRGKIRVKLPSVRVVLERMNIDPEIVQISNPVPVTSMMRTKTETRIDTKNRSLFAHLPPEEIPLKMKSLHVVLSKLNVSKTSLKLRNRRVFCGHMFRNKTVKKSLFSYPSFKSTRPHEPSHKKITDRIQKLSIDIENDNERYRRLVSNNITPDSFLRSPQNIAGPSSQARVDSFELSPITPNSAIRNQQNNPSTSHTPAPITSTPVIKSKNLPSDILDLSAISDSLFGEERKMHFGFEYSDISSILPATVQGRNLRSARTEGIESFKAHSNCDKPLFMETHSSIKEVTGDNDILQQLLDVCNQNEVLNFKDVYDWNIKSAKKVAEGSYGEVFSLTERKTTVIIKVIRISEKADGAQSMSSAYSEIKISQCLSKLREGENYRTSNFCLVKGTYLVKGPFPEKLLDAWDEFKEKDIDALNARPDSDSNKLYIIIEMGCGGQNLAYFLLRNAYEAEIVLKQIVISLAIAEETHLFEHRDLHLGNVLVQRTKRRTVSYIFRGKRVLLATLGLTVTIIDFTLSRILDRGVIYFNDLALEKSLFEQQGDLQYDAYRLSKFGLKNRWKESLLFTNVLWIHYLLTKLMNHRFSQVKSTQHANSLIQLGEYVLNVRKCTSALNFLEVCKVIEVPDKIETGIE